VDVGKTDNVKIGLLSWSVTIELVSLFSIRHTVRRRKVRNEQIQQIRINSINMSEKWAFCKIIMFNIMSYLRYVLYYVVFKCPPFFRPTREIRDRQSRVWVIPRNFRNNYNIIYYTYAPTRTRTHAHTHTRARALTQIQ